MFGRVFPKISKRYEQLALSQEEGLFSPIDLLFAASLDKHTTLSSSTLFLLSYLMKHAREGHICLSLDDLPKEVREGCLKGLEEAPAGVVEECGEDLFTQRMPTHPVIKYNHCLYLQRNWVSETALIESLRSIYQRTITPLVDIDRLHVLLKTKEMLTDEQRAAIAAALTEPLTLIVGGPGTGKSFTATHLLDLLKQSCLKSAIKVVVAAPTGKATFHLKSRLIENTSESASRSVLKIEAQTLHGLLGFPGEESKSIDADLVLVDEASMIDLFLMQRLLRSLCPGTRLVLIGDKDQLPPVEPGSPFSDFCNMIPSVVRLKEPKRFLGGVLIDFASALREGKVERAWGLLEGGDPALSLLKLDPESKEFLSYVEPFFLFGPSLTPQEIVKRFATFRILSSLRQGSLGVERLNQRIFEHLFQKEPRLAIPILLMKNSHTHSLYNGMTGVILEGYAYFEDKGGLREVCLHELPPYEYGYVISIHKSQGSEFEKVLLILAPGSELFGRELLYTGATRSKRELKILSTKECLEKNLSGSSYRQSQLQERFQVKR